MKHTKYFIYELNFNMITIKYGSIVLVLSMSALATFSKIIKNEGGVKVNLTIFYESVSTESKKLILEELKPICDQLGPYLSLKFVPFGHSRSRRNGTGFVCRLGPRECLGNLVQDCVFHVSGLEDHSSLTDYVACEMATDAAANGSFQCVQNANISISKVEECEKGETGYNRQLESEYRTKMSNLPFLPGILFNNDYDFKLQEWAMIDLFEAVCSFIVNAPACAKHFNLKALRELMES